MGRHRGKSTKVEPAAITELDCQCCGACCAYSGDCPMFDPDDPGDAAGIPASFISRDRDRMACDDGGRCAALVGVVGYSVTCGVYHQRPRLCREFMPGSHECLIVRELVLG